MQVQIVSVPWLWPIRHYGVLLTHGNGAAVVYANSPGHGVARQSLPEFSAGREIRFEPAPVAATPTPWEVIARAEGMVGRSYDLFRFNCDHFVAAAFGSKPESRQLQAAAIVVGAALLGRLSR